MVYKKYLFIWSRGGDDCPDGVPTHPYRRHVFSKLQLESAIVRLTKDSPSFSEEGLLVKTALIHLIVSRYVAVDVHFYQ